METTFDRAILELDHRSGDGIEVGLFWDRRADRTYVVLVDERTEEYFRIDVEASSGLDAFRHPFAYVPASLGSVRSAHVV